MRLRRTARDLAIGDCNGDGRPDFVVGTYSEGEIQEGEPGYLSVILNQTLRPVTITESPESREVDAGSSVTLQIAVDGDPELIYQWRRDGQPLADGTTQRGATVHRAQTAILTVAPALHADSGSVFDCVVTNECGTVVSDPAVIEVVCRADRDGDNVLTVPDIFLFLSDWFAGSVDLANYNNDCCINVADIFAFLSDWFAGCQ